MTAEPKIIDDVENVVVPEVVLLPVEDVAVPADTKEPEKKTFPRRGGDRDRGGRGRPTRGPRKDRDERRSEFAQKLIGIRRVARVMAGGRRFNFSGRMVLGDKKGPVGGDRKSVV